MTLKICDGTGSKLTCPTASICKGGCHFNEAELSCPDHWAEIQSELIWTTWAFVGVVLLGFALVASFVIGKVI